MTTHPSCTPDRALKLDHWWIASPGSPRVPVPPGALPGRLVGTVTGHPRIADGSVIVSTPITACHDDLIVTRSGSTYELGTVEESYSALYPNALRQLLESATRKCTAVEMRASSV